MAKTRLSTGNDNPFDIHDEVRDRYPQQERKRHAEEREEVWGLRQVESQKGIEENCVGSDDSDSSYNSNVAVESSVSEDMAKFEDKFRGITKRFRLINRIGEGTFSTVYKAEDLLYEHYYNEWDLDSPDASVWVSPPVKKRDSSKRFPRGPRYVAIKKIYVTSSPVRIQNELELLHDLEWCKSVCPLITAFRHQDQVVAVLPYYRHQDFREYFRDMVPSDMQVYFRSLFTALAAVHKHGILHRDIKPTNFLYDIQRERGVLVDFGLAEREGTDCSYCICRDNPASRRSKIENSYTAFNPPAEGYPKTDTRQSKRANRAGTRGFRAPEVLLKCTCQTTKIDVWSAGVILLTILSQRFPFFNSSDDIDAMIEIATIFGSRRMRNCALLHGSVFESTIPTIGEKGYTMQKLILWSTCRSKDHEGGDPELSAGEKHAIRLLERCLELDPSKRISAKEALEHDFLAEGGSLEQDEDEIEVLE